MKMNLEDINRNKLDMKGSSQIHRDRKYNGGGQDPGEIDMGIIV